MAAVAARQRQLLSAVLLCLGLLSVRVATAAEAAQKPKQVDVDAYALVQVPGCNVGKPNSLVLPPGGLLFGPHPNYLPGWVLQRKSSNSRSRAQQTWQSWHCQLHRTQCYLLLGLFSSPTFSHPGQPFRVQHQQHSSEGRHTSDGASS
jgi:hypothetical protein